MERYLIQRYALWELSRRFQAVIAEAWSDSLEHVFYLYLIGTVFPYWKIYKTNYIKRGEQQLKVTVDVVPLTMQSLQDTFQQIIERKKVCECP